MSDRLESINALKSGFDNLDAMNESAFVSMLRSSPDIELLSENNNLLREQIDMLKSAIHEAESRADLAESKASSAKNGP